MKKISVILLSLTMTVFEADSQDILGKWYGISDKYLAEFIIDKDSIKMQMLDSRESNIGHERGKIKHFGIYNIGDKKIIVIGDKTNKDELQYRAMTFFNTRGHSSIELAANGLTKATKTIKELINAIENDTTKLFGNVFYHKERIQELENLKDVETMSIDDFKLYLKTFIEKRDNHLYMEKLMTGTFHDQIVNKTLIELGYNPVYRNDWENGIFEKYLSDKEIEEIYRKRY